MTYTGMFPLPSPVLNLSTCQKKGVAITFFNGHLQRLWNTLISPIHKNLNSIKLKHQVRVLVFPSIRFQGHERVIWRHIWSMVKIYRSEVCHNLGQQRALACDEPLLIWRARAGTLDDEPSHVETAFGVCSNGVCLTSTRFIMSRVASKHLSEHLLRNPSEQLPCPMINLLTLNRVG